MDKKFFRENIILNYNIFLEYNMYTFKRKDQLFRNIIDFFEMLYNVSIISKYKPRKS